MLRSGSRPLFCTSFLLYGYSGCYLFFWRARHLLRYSRWLLTRRLGRNFQTRFPFFFFGLGAGIASGFSNCSGRFAEVASCARAKCASASATAAHRMTIVPRSTRTRKSPTRLRKVKFIATFRPCSLNSVPKRKNDFCWGVVYLFASLCFR